VTQQKATYGQNQGGTEAAKDRLRDMADATGESVKDAAQVTDEMARQLADQARQYGEQAQDLAKQVRPFLEKSMREQPIATLAGAAALAFALGALWRK
jgi:hypothetical protein